MPASRQLVQIVDAAVAESAGRAGHWLACRLGCTQCCFGVFPISQLDALRLREGMAELELCDPARAARVSGRARMAVARLAADFPGDPSTGVLEESAAAEARFESFADDEPCPALNPQTGACDLYEARPLTCRTFGPPVRCGDGGVAICELCFDGASEAEIAACTVELDTEALEAPLLRELNEAGLTGSTIVAFALAKNPSNQ